MWTIFKDCCVCYNTTSVLYIDFLVVRHTGSQPLNQGSNLHPPALEGEVLTTESPGKSLFLYLIFQNKSEKFCQLPC